MRISYWSSDVCTSDLVACPAHCHRHLVEVDAVAREQRRRALGLRVGQPHRLRRFEPAHLFGECCTVAAADVEQQAFEIGTDLDIHRRARSEEHTSELQSLMRISYAVFCLKKKKLQQKHLIRRRKIT